MSRSRTGCHVVEGTLRPVCDGVHVACCRAARAVYIALAIAMATIGLRE